ncbi:MAG: tRNA lysidine(34) synthetase TilS [Gammaproteobacteria bacterium]|nr:tRNA lysidine(34) synthetase TilS [Gammaproteobacteria bacterium]
MSAARTLTSADLLPHLEPHLQAPHWIIALSGGCDSVVLLHLLAQLRQLRPLPPLLALHVNHQLHPDAGQWQAWCTACCQRLAIPLVSHTVVVDAAHAGIEAAARQARYQVFTQQLGCDGVLLTGHHQDDQAETLLLQLMRGCGVQGAAAMPLQRRLGAGWLLRPLLGWRRQQLHDYARQAGLSWLNDPANQQLHYDRNYLRHEVIPALSERRQGVVSALARSTHHFAEAATLLDELALIDWQRGSETAPQRLAISQLQQLSEARAKNLLRYWLRQQGVVPPETAQLQAILHDMLTAAADRQPQVSWQGHTLSRYRDELYLLPQGSAKSATAGLPSFTLNDYIQEGIVPLPQGYLQFYNNAANPLAMASEWLQRPHQVEVRWRCGGERIELTQRGGHHRVKKLFQEAGIPQWQRQHWPLIYIDGELALIPNLAVASHYRVDRTTGAAGGVHIHWQSQLLADD